MGPGIPHFKKYGKVETMDAALVWLCNRQTSNHSCGYAKYTVAFDVEGPEEHWLLLKSFQDQFRLILLKSLQDKFR